MTSLPLPVYTQGCDLESIACCRTQSWPAFRLNSRPMAEPPFLLNLNDRVPLVTGRILIPIYSVSATVTKEVLEESIADAISSWYPLDLIRLKSWLTPMPSRWSIRMPSFTTGSAVSLLRYARMLPLNSSGSSPEPIISSSSSPDNGVPSVSQITHDCSPRWKNPLVI